MVCTFALKEAETALSQPKDKTCKVRATDGCLNHLRLAARIINHSAVQVDAGGDKWGVRQVDPISPTNMMRLGLLHGTYQVLYCMVPA
jgi:hypothetical protein